MTAAASTRDFRICCGTATRGCGLRWEIVCQEAPQKGSGFISNMDRAVSTAGQSAQVPAVQQGRPESIGVFGSQDDGGGQLHRSGKRLAHGHPAGPRQGRVLPLPCLYLLIPTPFLRSMMEVKARGGFIALYALLYSGQQNLADICISSHKRRLEGSLDSHQSRRRKHKMPGQLPSKITKGIACSLL